MTSNVTTAPPTKVEEGKSKPISPKETAWVKKTKELALKIKSTTDNKTASQLYLELGRHLETSSLKSIDTLKGVWAAFASSYHRDPTNSEARQEVLRLQNTLKALGVESGKDDKKLNTDGK